tara:strand:- start:134 stop:541 length:408 start_codon:yes stop_codon:yes gene_type:complete
MFNETKNFINSFNDPIKEIETIRKGVQPYVIENCLLPQAFVMKDILERLHIPKSTYLAKKKNKSPLDPFATEKLMRVVSIVNITSEVLGKDEARSWLYKEVSSLGNQKPIDLLDTDVGHRLVEQALMQIKYGVYN